MKNTLVSLIALALVSNAVAAEEVGAPNPQVTSQVGASLVEAGASRSWASQPVNVSGDSYVTVHQMKEFDARVDEINNELNAKLTKLIEDRLSSSITK